MVKIFLTGATGFIGGEALSRIASEPLKHQISCLVRDSAKASTLTKAYPGLRIVDGDLDNVEVIKTEARAADVVFHLASTGHLPSATAIAAGLSDTARTNPGYWIQMSGATMVAGDEIAAGRYGEAPTVSYDDLRDTAEIRSVIQKTASRKVDQLLLSQDSAAVRTALIAGPIIHGVGNGPVNRRSIQCPEITRLTLQRGKAPVVGKGLNEWGAVHIHDLGQLFALLLDAAVSQRKDVWNENGLYCPENEKLSFGEIAEAIAKEAHAQKYTESPQIDHLSADEANSLSSHAAVIWGTNAVLTGQRAKTQLGWRPSGHDLPSGIPDLVRSEAKRLELSPRS